MLRAGLTIMDPHRLLGGLRLDVRPRLTLVVVYLALSGYGRLRVVSCLRTLDAQRRLYGRGRSRAECIAADVPADYALPEAPQVTWCLPEHSQHVRGLAMDLDLTMYCPYPWEAVRRAAGVCGVKSGSLWAQRDGGHFEV